LQNHGGFARPAHAAPGFVFYNFTFRIRKEHERNFRRVFHRSGLKKG
jgi:hypothetical protein